MPYSKDSSRLARAYRAVLSLTGLSVGLLIVTLFCLFRQRDRVRVEIVTPETRDAVIASLAEGTHGMFDSHVDPEVGRVNLPNIHERKMSYSTVSTNRFGIRERNFQVPKARGTLRVVLLGDSMVYGLGSPAEDRLGVHLERWLREHSVGFNDEIEVLHIGVSSWNIVAETAWLRRQISELDPDLVLHLIVPNDIDDSGGVRGFGTQSSVSTYHRERADSMVEAGFPIRVLNGTKVNFLRLGLDYESQFRYQEAAQRISQLHDAVDRVGGQYRLIVHFRRLNPVAAQSIGSHLPSQSSIYLSKRFSSDRSYNIAPHDPHWNRQGHEVVARVLYHLIVRDRLLPELSLSPWVEAEEAFHEFAVSGGSLRKISEKGRLRLYGTPKIRSVLNIPSLLLQSNDPWRLSQISGGMDLRGQISPYASFLLRNEGLSVQVTGHSLPRPELDGAEVRVFADDELLGKIVLEADQPIDFHRPVPERLLSRSFLSIRFVSSDYVYDLSQDQHCVVFRLDRLAIESR